MLPVSFYFKKAILKVAKRPGDQTLHHCAVRGRNQNEETDPCVACSGEELVATSSQKPGIKQRKRVEEPLGSRHRTYIRRF